MEGGMRLNQKQVELVKRRYPPGTKLCLDCMEGEPQMPAGLKGEVFMVDDIGQIHAQWGNGSTLALNPEIDQFHKISGQKKNKEREEPSL